MDTMGHIHDERKEHEQAVEWYTMAAEAGLPKAMHNLACSLEEGSRRGGGRLPGGGGLVQTRGRRRERGRGK